MANIDDKKDDIIEKLDRLFSDTSVSKRETLEALEEIESEVNSKIDALKSDIKNEERAAESAEET